MAISINLRMTRGEWADFADWLDVRYTPEGWTFYRAHEETRLLFVKREWENPDYHPTAFYNGALGTVGLTVVIKRDGIEAEEFTLIKMFHDTATVVSHGTFPTPVGAQ